MALIIITINLIVKNLKDYMRILIEAYRALVGLNLYRPSSLKYTRTYAYELVSTLEWLTKTNRRQQTNSRWRSLFFALLYNLWHVNVNVSPSSTRSAYESSQSSHTV